MSILCQTNPFSVYHQAQSVELGFIISSQVKRPSSELYVICLKSYASEEVESGCKLGSARPEFMILTTKTCGLCLFKGLSRLVANGKNFRIFSKELFYQRHRGKTLQQPVRERSSESYWFANAFPVHWWFYKSISNIWEYPAASRSTILKLWVIKFYFLLNFLNPKSLAL